jgi:hypothetical protein
MITRRASPQTGALALINSRNIGLRIVGLGKLTELAIHIAGLPGAAGHQDVLRGLTGAVMRDDYERAFEVSLKLLLARGDMAAPYTGVLSGLGGWDVATASKHD